MKGNQRVPGRFVGFMTFSSSASAMSLKFTESNDSVYIYVEGCLVSLA
jgi:hypothetical protein